MKLRWLTRYETKRDLHEGFHYVPVRVLQVDIDGSGWQDVPEILELDTPNKAER